jgi:hypothetical protein
MVFSFGVAQQQQEMNEAKSSSRTLAILTLRRHKDGIWIRRLMDAIQEHHRHEEGQSAVTPEVVALEDFFSTPISVSSENIRDDDGDSIDKYSLHASLGCWTGVVNRISDAAEPWEVKATMGLLQVAKTVWNIPVWNGPEAYSLCTHKWCHHLLFRRAGLHSPHTVAGLLQQHIGTEETDDGTSKLEQANASVKMLMKQQPNDAIEMEYLVKPNAGGFGAGIEMHKAARRRKDSISQSEHGDCNIDIGAKSIPEFTDRFVLFQTYVPPKDGKIYRVWFLRDKVQCAVMRTVETSQQPTSTDFSLGCSGGVCLQRCGAKARNNYDKNDSIAPMLVPWLVPEDVKREIEDQLVPALPDDAHCGSVEFMYGPEGDDASPQRLYFDLNLLSTLPLDFQSLEPSRPDPWIQLANGIINFCSIERRPFQA